MTSASLNEREHETKDRSRNQLKPALWITALAAVAIVLLYLGIVIAVSVAGGSPNLSGIAGAIGYVAIAVGIPVVVALLLYRIRGWGWISSIGAGAGFCVLINVLLIPFAFVILAM